MLPYFKSVREVEIFIEFLNTSKIEPSLLIETTSAIDNLNDILKIYQFKYVHIGLNDIHIERKTNFMFEPYVDGLIHRTVKILNDNNVNFGIGGIGRIGSNLLPTPECIINEHTRLNSSGVILSRSFKGNFIEERKEFFERELSDALFKLRESVKYSKTLDENMLLENYDLLKNDINKVIDNINEKKQIQ